MRRVAVIDIGKTNAKVAVVDLALGAEMAVLTQPNVVLQDGPYPHFDTDGLWGFVRRGLRAMAAHGIDGISVTTHGACAAWLDADGGLACPVLDYEHDGPDGVRSEYEALRPDFAVTGSPALPHGLNLGAQLHWQLSRDAGLAQRTAEIVTWPQYWGFMLTGEAACDLCSLGCHTDLWEPAKAQFSPLVAALGLHGTFAPARRPDAVLGVLTPALQAEFGIGAVPVLVGIHDSNASLYPHLLARDGPFSVVSTGTWVIAMAMGAEPAALNPARDVLVNVNALGNPVPSARFMGGREYELIREGRAAMATGADADSVLSRGVMLFPSVVPDSGPFQGRAHSWSHKARTDAETEVALGYYLALMTAECLGAIGARGPVLVEGPFGENPWYLAMLAAATGRGVERSAARTGTAVGAAMLFSSETRGLAGEVVLPDPKLMAYAKAWGAAMNTTQGFPPRT
jgi:sugar (pentulose or hexulose) kinase